MGMGKIAGNIANACITLNVEHVVLFPFGMGAFLRHLALLDDAYAVEEELQNLRRSVALRLLHGISRTSAVIHLCLQFSSEEARRNGDAFLRALVGEETLRSRV